MSDSLDAPPKRPPRKQDSLDGSLSPAKTKIDPLGGSGSRIKKKDPMDDPLGGSGSRVKTNDPLDDPLSRSGSRIKKKDPLDDPLDGSGSRVKKKDPMDDPLSGGAPRSQRKGPPASLKGSLTLGDIDGSPCDNVLKEAPRRTLSSELDSSLVIGESNWKTLETVHARTADDFEDSDSFMGDSFAGSSFHTQESWYGGESDNDLPLSPLDDESTKSAESGPRKITPRRTYSKQSKRMPKKMDPLSAITEVETNDDDNDDDDDSF